VKNLAHLQFAKVYLGGRFGLSLLCDLSVWKSRGAIVILSAYES